MMLDIVIPSYNRFNLLSKQLDFFASNIRHCINLTVINNNSSDKRYFSLTKKYPFIHVVNNPINVGIIGNILKSYEYSKKGDYLWILSDDDDVYDSAISRILSSMKKKPDYIYLKAQVKGDYTIKCKNGSYIYDVRKFIKDFSSISMLGLISSSIYRYDFIKDSIFKGYLGGYTLFPHVAIFFDAISKNRIIKVDIIENSLKWKNRPNSYLNVLHMAYLNHFYLDSFLEKQNRKIFRITYVKEWGNPHIAKFSLEKKEACNILKQSKTFHEFFLLAKSLLIFCIKYNICKYYRKVVCKCKKYKSNFLGN